MSVRNDDNIIKSLVILAVCIVAMLMVCTECALLPQYGWLWLILLLILAISDTRHARNAIPYASRPATATCTWDSAYRSSP